MFFNPIKYSRYLLLALLVSPVGGFAGNSDEWVVTGTSYLWMTGMEGKVATVPPAPPAELDVSFSDVMSNLDIALMGFLEARKGRFGVFGEVFYVGISTDARTPGPFFAGADYEQDLWGVSFGGSYELTQSDDYQINAVGGVRFWDLDNELELNAGRLAARKISERETWMDGFIGLRGKADIDANWYVSGWGITTVAGDSDSAWDVYAGVGYKYSDALSVSVGYRHQEVDYDDGLFLFDVELSGPAIGLTYRF